jgi:hypothetical protein
MKTFTTKTTLMAAATAALLSIGGTAMASAQEFTLPNGDAGTAAASASATPAHARGGYVALAYLSHGGRGQTATGGPAGGPNQGG